MRFLRQSMIGFFLASMTLGMLVFAGLMIRDALQVRFADAPPSAAPRERVFAVTLTRAEPGREQPVLRAFGEISSRRTLELRTAVAGRIISLSEEFEDGGSVSEGDVLLQIDPRDAQSELDRLTADLEDARAEVRDAGRSLGLAREEQKAAADQADLRARAFERQSDLSGRGVGTAAAVETAELAAAAARAVVISTRQAVTQAEVRIDLAATRLSRAEIALEDARRSLTDTTIKAPFDGVLSETAVVAGGLVSVNERLADLIDPSDLEVAFRVSTAQYTRLLDAAGDLIPASVTATLDVTGADLRAVGSITRVSAGAAEGQTGRLIFATLSDPRGFRPGDFVTVTVQEPPLDGVVRLPAAALGAAGDVLVMGEDSRLISVPVTLLRRQGNEIIVSGEGLEGRDVVNARTPLLGPGIAVRPLDTAAALEEQAAAVSENIELTDERRARLVAFVRDNGEMPEAARARVLAQLAETRVPRRVVRRIESRMGG
ncbi:HlyD family efflux transporter periplasmic adaptor subunit [uncultured Roseobacter sp.]|uniref:efflux RND transporter periplasmic adaptor subunit n=1 Tax=uncultured Roseobacter sp. TaxID=114847 RepID=UPI00263161D6|nr:HlyD family efflux transporter periplasmic adaptor subunit [uncultured Roseobacter sp.]